MISFTGGEIERVKHQLLAWAAAHPYCAYLDSCESETDRFGKYELLVGVGGSQARRITGPDLLARLPADWVMGIFPYELKAALHPRLAGKRKAAVDFGSLALFVPETVLCIPRGDNCVYVTGVEPEGWNVPATLRQESTLPEPRFQADFNRDEYLSTVERLREHIREGDFYELNFTQGFHASCRVAQPAELFRRLIDISPVPFAGFFRFGERYLLCASPERFLQRNGEQILSQPIKGTAGRGATPEADRRQALALQQSLKERAENVMIVDLTRNDFNRICRTHSVEVPSLFELQTFPQVHQLVSTIRGRLQAGIGWRELLHATFPPGSMTGAPKWKVMQMTERYERSARGAYAGSLGYITPEGDGDLNVIIRSLVYDHQQEQLGYHVGGAITYDSVAGQEYEEMLLKAAAIRSLFKADNFS